MNVQANIMTASSALDYIKSNIEDLNELLYYGDETVSVLLKYGDAYTCNPTFENELFLIDSVHQLINRSQAISPILIPDYWDVEILQWKRSKDPGPYIIKDLRDNSVYLAHRIVYDPSVGWLVDLQHH